ENAREHNLPESAEAHDATAASPSLSTSAGATAGTAASTEHIEGAPASVAKNLSVDSAPYEAAPFERAMMTFVNTRSEGLTILPTHRVVSNIPDFSWATVRRYLEPWFAAEVFT